MSSTDSVQPPPSEGTSQTDPPTEQVLRNAISMNNMADAQFQSLQGTINKGSKRRKTSSLIDLSQTTMKDINMAHLIANMKLDAAGRKALFEALDANEKREQELAMASEENDENMDTGDGNYIFPKKSKRARKLSPKLKNNTKHLTNQFEILRIEDSSDDELELSFKSIERDDIIDNNDSNFRMAELIQEDTLNQTENNSDIENLDPAINANFIKNPTCEDEPELIINDSNTGSNCFTVNKEGTPKQNFENVVIVDNTVEREKNLECTTKSKDCNEKTNEGIKQPPTDSSSDDEIPKSTTSCCGSDTLSSELTTTDSETNNGPHTTTKKKKSPKRPKKKWLRNKTQT